MSQTLCCATYRKTMKKTKRKTTKRLSKKPNYVIHEEVAYLFHAVVSLIESGEWDKHRISQMHFQISQVLEGGRPI